MKPYARDFHVVCKKEFETSMMGELNFFLGLQVKKMKHGTFLGQNKYCIELIKKFGMEKCKEASIPMATSTYLDLNEKGKSVDESRSRDSNFVGCKLDKKKKYKWDMSYTWKFSSVLEFQQASLCRTFNC